MFNAAAPGALPEPASLPGTGNASTGQFPAGFQIPCSVLPQITLSISSIIKSNYLRVLWQLDIFRRSLRGLTGHVCQGDACIFCALKAIFSQFQHSREKALPSDNMRHALAESFKDEQRFQLGFMDDAAECFENILERIHFHLVPNSETDMCTSKSCISHQKFAMTLYEQCVCRSCGASSDPLPFTEFVRYISTTALCNEVEKMMERNERLKPEMFAELLQAANTADDYRKCPVRFEKRSAVKADHVKENGIGDSTNQRSNKKLQPDNPAFSRSHIQASGGRGPAKLGYSEQKDRLKDLSRECAQKAADMKNFTSLRKDADRGPRKESGRQRDLIGEERCSAKSGSPPVGNGLRHCTDQRIYSSQGRGPYKHDNQAPHQAKPSAHVLGSNKTEPFPAGEKAVTRTRTDGITGYDTDTSQDSRDKGSISSRSRSKGWKPMRETLNVDSIFSETEKKQPSPKHKANLSSKSKHEKERSFNHWPKENQMQKGLMTIYEDETKQDTGSRSSLDSEGKGNAEKSKGFTERKIHGDNWQIQRTESGYESSDHISNGSANPDSPVIEGINTADAKNVKESASCSEQNLPTKKADSVVHSVPQQNRSFHAPDLRKDQIGSEVNYRPHPLVGFPTELHLQVPSPPVKRAEMPETNRKFFPSSALQPVVREIVKSDSRSKASEPNSSEWLQAERFEKPSVPVYCADSVSHPFPDNACGRKPPHSDFPPPAQLQSHHTRSVSHHTLGPKVGLVPCAPQSLPERLAGPPAPPGEHGGHLLRRADPLWVPEAVYQNIPPPLPPKKYALSTLAGSESNLVADGKSTEALQNSPLRQTGAPSKSASEASAVPAEQRLKEPFPGNEVFVHKPDSPPRLSVNEFWTVSENMLKKGSRHTGPSPAYADGNDNVSLTTYFSVDSCMTDTYRLKYHQRPKLYFTESGSFHKEKHPPAAGGDLNATYPAPLEPRHPTPEQRYKASAEGIHCSR
ncbi:hypothetical protein TURU_126655 [Turdus rufiventris]|nr:hypothetical protein TURU_126655 [Turdus rufiventris]